MLEVGGLLERIRKERLGVHGLVVDELGQPLVEHRFRSDDRTNLYSAAKTFTSLAVGLSRDEGLLALDDKVLDFFPEHARSAADGVAQITVEHLLTMTAGSPYTMFSDDEKRVPDILAAFLQTPLVHEPGSRFEYSSGCSYVLSRVVERVHGQPMREVLLPRLFEPLGIWNPLWGASPGGHTWGGSDLHLTTEEYSRLGRLLLRDGVWEGQRLVPSEWVRLMPGRSVDSSVWTDDPEGRRYGLHVWLCSPPGAYRADGRYGQHCVVMPEQGLSVTVTGHEEHSANRVLQLLWEELLPPLPGASVC